MGTRSTTTIWDGDKKVLSFYRQFDGYPSVHGQELADCLKRFDLTSGISYPDMREDTTRQRANGAGCLAAQILVHFKTGIKNWDMETGGKLEDMMNNRTLREGDHVGGIYAIPHEDAGGQAYHYDVIIISGDNYKSDFIIEMQTDYGWVGTPEEFDGSEHEELEV